MIRNARRRRVLFVVVIALAGLLVAPIDECDDYTFLRPGTPSVHAGLAEEIQQHPDAETGAGGEHRHVCSCLVCVLTTNDSFVPDLPAPQRGEAEAIIPAVLFSSLYLPAVFRPPIV